MCGMALFPVVFIYIVEEQEHTCIVIDVMIFEVNPGVV